jgi:hypothetical protein
MELKENRINTEASSRLTNTTEGLYETTVSRDDQTPTKPPIRAARCPPPSSSARVPGAARTLHGSLPGRGPCRQRAPPGGAHAHFRLAVWADRAAFRDPPP